MHRENDKNAAMCESDAERNGQQRTKLKYDVLHICRDYVEPEALSVDQTTINRVKDAGLGQILPQFAIDCLDNIQLIEGREYSYYQLAQIIGMITHFALPLLEEFRTPDIEIGSFVSPDTGLLNKVYLSQMQHGIILCTMGENRVLEVRDVSSMEIWRYLYASSKVIESIASMLITVAEKHRSIKGEWMSSFGRIIGLSHDDKNKANEWPADQRLEDPSS